MNRAEFILQNKDLFWDVPESKLLNLSDDTLASRIMQYGDLNSLIILSKIFGMQNLKLTSERLFDSKRSGFSKSRQNFIKIFVKAGL